MGTKKKRSSAGRIGFLDVFIILLCLLGAAYFVNRFRLDLFSTITSRDEKPVGTITIKINTIQRRLSDRVLWDRLNIKSPVYLGDLIRVAEHSSATLSIDGNDLNLEENTLIRIIRSGSGDGPIKIELSQGSMGISAGTDSGTIALDLMGRTVEIVPGTVLYAEADEEGISLQINEGAVTITGDENSVELSSGTMVAFDAAGTERAEKAVVILLPKPNARYLKGSSSALNVAFAWNRINLEEGETLLLEIAEDRNFSRIQGSIAGLYSEAAASLNAGLWYWRLSSDDSVLSNGQFTIADAAGPVLISPASGSLYRYQENSPLRFQWEETGNASSYIFEASQTQGFANPAISRQTDASFLVDSSLEPGTWYWRVKPVFSPMYEGSASFSAVSFFSLERSIEQDSTNVVEIRQPETLPEFQQLVEAGLLPAPAETGKPEETEAAAETPPPPPEPLPPLPAPQNRLPAADYRIGPDEIRSSRSLSFSWNPVQGANAYIFTLYEETPGGRRQVLVNPAVNRTSWTLNDLGTLGRGAFFWQVEAVSMDGTGIVRRGTAGGNNFVIDIPSPGPVILEEPGILYGN